MDKQERFTLRLTENEKESWNYYAISIGYESVSEFIRDSINAIIMGKKKPHKIIEIK